MPPSVASAPGSIAKKSPVPLQMLVQLHARDAGFHGCIEVVGVDREDAVHAREVDAHPAVKREHMAFERTAGAECDDGNIVLAAERDDLRDFRGGFGIDDGVGRRDVVRRFVLAMLLEYRGAGGDPVAEFSLQRGQQGGGERFAQWLRGVHGRRWTGFTGLTGFKRLIGCF